MNHMTPMYCHSCNNLQRAATKTLDYCSKHQQPAFYIVTHCVDVGGKSERVIFHRKERS